MSRLPVYTKDMRGLRGLSDKDKQRIIDEKTDRLATFMAKRHYGAFLLGDDYRNRRGGYSKRMVEQLNSDGYVVAVFHSIAEVAECFGCAPWKPHDALKKKRALLPGVFLKFKEL